MMRKRENEENVNKAKRNEEKWSKSRKTKNGENDENEEHDEKSENYENEQTLCLKNDEKLGGRGKCDQSNDKWWEMKQKIYHERQEYQLM